VLLALAAGAIGTALAWGGVRALVAVMPSVLVRFSYNPITMDLRVLVFAFGLTLATGLVFGLLPALRAAATQAARAGRAATASTREIRIRSLVQVAQFALAVLLLSGAGLFGRSFYRLLSVPLGYDLDRVLELQLVSLERLRGDPEAAAAFARELDARLASLPGVIGVARHGGMGIGFDWTLELDDGRRVELGDSPIPLVSVDTAFFRVMGVPIVEGRAFLPEDALPESSGVIVDKDFAAALWPGESALGRSFRESSGERHTVVGVAADTKLFGPLEPFGPRQIFYAAPDRDLRSGVVLVRTAGDPEALIAPVRALVREMDPGQPIQSLRTARQAMVEEIADPRFLLVIMAVFASVALTLAAVGVYGLVSFTVAQRTREIGVRMALGARGRTVMTEVLGRGLLLAFVGAALGLGGAALLSRFVSALLFDVSPTDLPTLVLAAAALLAACALALVLPAWSAASVAPVEALRVE
jgi:predicted permease